MENGKNTTLTVEPSRVRISLAMIVTPGSSPPITIRPFSSVVYSPLALPSTCPSFTPGGTTNVGGGTNGGNDLVFENDPKTRLIIEGQGQAAQGFIQEGERLGVHGVHGDRLGLGTLVDDVAGGGLRLEPGTVITAREIKTVDGFVLDGTPKSVKITAGPQAPELVFWNKRAGTLVIMIV